MFQGQIVKKGYIVAYKEDGQISYKGIELNSDTIDFEDCFDNLLDAMSECLKMKDNKIFHIDEINILSVEQTITFKAIE